MQQHCDEGQLRLLAGRENWCYRAAPRLHCEEEEGESNSRSSSEVHLWQTRANAVTLWKVTGGWVTTHTQITYQS